MKKILLSLFLVLLHASILYAQKLPSTLLWKIEGNGLSKPSYLYGTIHLTDERVFNLGDSLYKAIENSDGFAIEVDPEALTGLIIDEAKKSLLETKRIKELVLEDENIERRMLEISSTDAWGAKGNIYYGLALDKALLGLDQQAVQYLDSAFIYRYRYKESFENDPVFEKIRSLSSFRIVQEKMDNFHGFRKRAFINAFSRAKASRELKGVEGEIGQQSLSKSITQKNLIRCWCSVSGSPQTCGNS